MAEQKYHNPPIFDEALTNKLKFLLREDKPFTTRAFIEDQNIYEIANEIVEENGGYGKNVGEFIGLNCLRILSHLKFRDKVYRRWNSANEKYEKLHNAFMLYPSNDRARYHLAESERFVSLGQIKAGKESEQKAKEAPLHFRTLPIGMIENTKSLVEEIAENTTNTEFDAAALAELVGRVAYAGAIMNRAIELFKTTEEDLDQLTSINNKHRRSTDEPAPELSHQLVVSSR